MRASLRATGGRVNHAASRSPCHIIVTNAPCPQGAPCYLSAMAASPVPAALDRIERALARIEAAAAARDTARLALQRRHETLRTRMGEAIAAIDALIEREPADG